MPYEIEVDPKARVVFLRASDPVSLEDGQAVLMQLAAHPDFEAGFGLLCNFHELEQQPDPNDVLEGAKLLRFHPLLRGRIGMVISAALATPAEVFAALTALEGVELRVFADPEEARSWVLDGADASYGAV